MTVLASRLGLMCRAGWRKVQLRVTPMRFEQPSQSHQPGQVAGCSHVAETGPFDRSVGRTCSLLILQSVAPQPPGQMRPAELTPEARGAQKPLDEPGELPPPEERAMRRTAKQVKIVRKPTSGVLAFRSEQARDGSSTTFVPAPVHFGSPGVTVISIKSDNAKG